MNHTFDCGQCFRWVYDENKNLFKGISKGKICMVKDNTVICPDEDNEFWAEYFCLDIDLSEMKKGFIKKDKNLKKCIDFGGGIRILHQDIWETIISFIISSNNNIPRIKKIIETLCKNFGEKIDDDFYLR